MLRLCRKPLSARIPGRRATASGRRFPPFALIARAICGHLQEADVLVCEQACSSIYWPMHKDKESQKTTAFESHMKKQEKGQPIRLVKKTKTMMPEPVLLLHDRCQFGPHDSASMHTRSVEGVRPRRAKRRVARTAKMNRLGFEPKIFRTSRYLMLLPTSP